MNAIRRFLKEEKGSGVVEAILIIVVLILLVSLFKESLRPLVEGILDKITANAGKI